MRAKRRIALRNLCVRTDAGGPVSAFSPLYTRICGISSCRTIKDIIFAPQRAPHLPFKDLVGPQPPPSADATPFKFHRYFSRICRGCQLYDVIFDKTLLITTKCAMLPHSSCARRRERWPLCRIPRTACRRCHIPRKCITTLHNIIPRTAGVSRDMVTRTACRRIVRMLLQCTLARIHFSGFYRMPAKLRRKLKPHREEHIAAVKDEVVAEELLFEVVIVFVKPVHNFARFGVGRVLP